MSRPTLSSDIETVLDLKRRDAIESLCSRHQFDHYGPGTEVCRCGVVMGGRHATHLAIVIDRYLAAVSCPLPAPNPKDK